MSNDFFLSTKSKQIERVQFILTSSKGRNFVRHCCQNRQQCRSNIRLCRRAKFYDKLVRQCCPFWQQGRILLRQSRTLLRHCCLLLQHCCWCRRGFMRLTVAVFCDLDRSRTTSCEQKKSRKSRPRLVENLPET